MELPQGPSSTAQLGPDAAVFRDQLTKLQGLVGLSMVMTERADASQIAKLAASVVSSLAPVRCDGVFVAKRGWLEAAGPCLRREVRGAVEKQLRGLPGQWGSVQIAGEPWAWALPMRSFEGALGHLVIAGEGPVQESEQLLLRMLAQQLGIAIANADSHTRERATAGELGKVNLRLERSLAIHSRLTQAEVEGRGMGGIAEIVHELTGYPVVIEDSRGKRLASAGLGPADPEEQASDWRPDLEELTRNHPAAVRLGDRLATACATFGDTFAVLALLDPSGRAGEEERMALEHGATVLALELSRLQSVLEAESRLSGDLLEELLLGTDDERARMRTQMLGYDLGLQQRVAVLDYPKSGSPDEVFHAVRRAAQSLDTRPLLGSRRGTVVVLADASLSWHSLRAEIDVELGHEGCRIGVGGSCNQAADVPRSYQEAQLALQLLASGPYGSSVISFDALGVFEMLADVKDPDTIHRFVRRWLGAVLDYDEIRGAELVPTLSAYLEGGQSYGNAAHTLGVHRNTLRYRLGRIGEISSHDLGDPDVQFNLQLACRAWRTLAAIKEVEQAPRPGL